MDTAALDELRELRARAYGPAADIDRDPDALRRLQELETQRGNAVEQPVAEPVEAAPPTGAPVSAVYPAPPAAGPLPKPEPSAPAPGDPDAAAEPVAEAASPDPDEIDRTTPASPPTRERRLRVTALWMLSLVAAAVLAAGATYTLTHMAPVPTSNGQPQIATLEPDPLVEVPAGWMGAGPSSLAFEFYGLTLFETTGGFGGPGTDCFAVVASEQLPEPGSDANSWSYSGNFYTGCRAGGFPATVQLEISSGAPEALRSRFGDDGALQFVLDGGRVGVYLDAE